MLVNGDWRPSDGGPERRRGLATLSKAGHFEVPSKKSLHLFWVKSRRAFGALRQDSILVIWPDVCPKYGKEPMKK